MKSNHPISTEKAFRWLLSMFGGYGITEAKIQVSGHTSRCPILKLINLLESLSLLTPGKCDHILSVLGDYICSSYICILMFFETT